MADYFIQNANERFMEMIKKEKKGGGVKKHGNAIVQIKFKGKRTIKETGSQQKYLSDRRVR